MQTLISQLLCTEWMKKCYIQVPEQFKCFTLINCGNKSKSFLSFISFIIVSQHRVQVSCTSSHSIKSYLIQFVQVTQAHYKLLSSFTNSFTAKAVPHMLSSVLTDALQMLPSAVNSHKKVSVHGCKKLYITKRNILLIE